MPDTYTATIPHTLRAEPIAPGAARFQSLLARGLDPVLLFGPDGAVLHATPAGAAIMGYRPDELENMNGPVLIHPDDQARVGAAMAAVLAAPDGTAAEEYRVRHRDGSWRWLEARAVNLLHEPDVGALVVSFRDVTRRREAEDALRASERRFRALVENSADAVEVLAADGTILYATSSVVRAGGRTADEVVGRNAFEWCHPDDLAGLAEANTRFLAEPGAVVSGEYRYRHKDGTWRWAAATCTNRLSDPAVGGVVVNLRDVTERVRAESVLRGAMEASLDAVYILTCDRDAHGRVEDFRFADLNRNGAALVDMDPAAVAGRRLCELFPVNRTGGFFEKYVRVVETGAPLEEEFPARTPGGRDVWLRHQVVRAGDGVVITARDVTARKAAEGALRGREELLRTVITNIPCGVFWKDRDSVFLGCNDLFARNHALPGPDAVVGRTDIELGTTAAEAEGFRACDRRVMEGGEPLLGIEEALTRPDGSKVVLLTSKVPLRDGSGAVVGVLGVYQDITARKRAEDEAVAWKARYEAAVKATGQVLYDWDAAADRLAWGGSCVPTLGRAEAEMPSDLAGWRAMIHPDDRAAFDREAERTTATRSPFRLEYRVRRRDGRYVTVDDQGHFVAPVSGSSDRVVGFVADVTERRRLEEQLRQAQKMEAVGQLAGGVAHDFNNLLTVINGYSDLVSDGLPAHEPARAMVDEVRQAGQRAAELTQQLLAFGRKQVLQKKVLDPNEVVAGLVGLLGRLIGEDVRLEVRPGANLRRVLADPGQLGQVLMNLAVNARDAMPTGGTLSVATRNADLGAGRDRDGAEVPAGPYVLLEISDTGCGMPPEVLAHLFEPFFTTKGPGKGTGLGLATAYGVVKQSGGHIEVDSAVGAGTTFRVYLPGTSSAAAVKPEVAGRAPPRGTEVVLLVEDEPGVRALAARVLRGHGYTVLTAAGAEQAVVATAQAPRVDLLLTDVVMPGASGRVLAEQLHAGRPGLRVLYMSGYTDDAVVRHGVAVERAPFIQKPFSPDTLARKVREVLDAPPGPGAGPPGL